MKRFLLLLALLGAAWAAPVFGGQPTPPPPPERPTMIVVTPGPTPRASKTPFLAVTLVKPTPPAREFKRPHTLYLPWIAIGDSHAR